MIACCPGDRCRNHITTGWSCTGCTNANVEHLTLHGSSTSSDMPYCTPFAACRGLGQLMVQVYKVQRRKTSGIYPGLESW